MPSDTLSPNHRRALQAVADGTCFVAMSGTLMDLGDDGCLEFDATLPIPWRVTLAGYEALAIGEEQADAE